MQQIFIEMRKAKAKAKELREDIGEDRRRFLARVVELPKSERPYKYGLYVRKGRKVKLKDRWKLQIFSGKTIIESNGKYYN